MRKIKFRAYEKHLKEIIKVNDINFETKIINTTHLWRRFDEIELMQYTGLKDKNGKEIYEGDIVKDLRSPFKDARSYSKVFYQEDRGRFVFGGWEIPAGMSHTFEVIGNIYENPELLEGAE